MSTLQPGKFCTYDLSEREENQGKLLTPYNKQFLQNLMAEVADDIISCELPVTQESLDHYRQFIIHAQAKITVITELLNHSVAAEEWFNVQQQVASFNPAPTGNIYDQFTIPAAGANPQGE